MAAARSVRIPFLATLGLLASCATTDDAVDDSHSVELHSPTVSEAVQHDTSTPLMEIAPAARIKRNIVHEVKPLPRPGRVVDLDAEEAVLQNSPLSDPEVSAPTNMFNFDGIGDGIAGFSVNSAPPDTNGDVGGNWFVQVVNSDIAVYNKTTGAVVLGPEPTNTLWSGFGGLCQTDNDGDAVVVFDPIASRWVVSQFAVSGTSTHFLECVAVSQTSDPTGAWHRYAFDYGNAFPDYPKMGVWPDAYYITFNMFNAAGTAFLGGRVCAYDRARMLQGLSATQVCFNPQDGTGTNAGPAGGLLPADLDGARLPPAGAPNYVLALGNNPNQLAFYRFHVDFTTPSSSTLTGPTDIDVASYSMACNGGTCIPQTGTTQRLDSLADRLMFRLAYRNFSDHEALLATHAITAGSSTGVRWYELRVASGSPSVFQQATYAPDASFRWMSAGAMDQSGNIAIGYSVSSSTLHPGLRFTGRLAGDTLGIMTQGDNVIFTGAGSQTGSSLSRWGDYANMVVDPSDDCTFYFTSEYIPANGAFNWRTRAGSFRLPNCGGVVSDDFSISASPTTVTVLQGASGMTTIGTAVTSGSAQSVALSIGGLPPGATAVFNPTSVTAGGSSTLALAAGAATPAGSYTLTITGTGASATHTTAVSFVVNAPTTNDFSISASPGSVSAAQGGSGTTTINTSVTSGGAQTVRLTASGLPAGATATFTPATVTAGGSASLALAAGASTAPGTYPVTVTGTGDSVTHTTSVSFTVTPGGGGGGGLVNGTFETGDFTGWTRAGTTSMGGAAHSGSFAATVGLLTTATNGDSSIAQTFTVSPSGGTLSFWYNVHCPDSVTYDWATATLRDNTSGVTTTVLAKTCTNNSAWKQATASLVAGHSVTLTLISHDDNYAGDGTSVQYDDVTILTPVTNPVVNPGFENGLTGWTSAGTTATSTTAHSGAASARAGSTAPTVGDSSVAQTFTVPSGASRVTFWYRVFCPDTVTYDWATATLRDNTTAVTTTILPRTCTNNNTWVQGSGNLVAGHSVTLTFISHDDDYVGDATLVYFDDVAVQ